MHRVPNAHNHARTQTCRAIISKTSFSTIAARARAFYPICVPPRRKRKRTFPCAHRPIYGGRASTIVCMLVCGRCHHHECARCHRCHFFCTDGPMCVWVRCWGGLLAGGVYISVHSRVRSMSMSVYIVPTTYSPLMCMCMYVRCARRS